MVIPSDDATANKGETNGKQLNCQSDTLQGVRGGRL